MIRSSVVVLTSILLASTNTFAALRVWPTGVCNSTLQACVDGATAGDEIRVDTDSPINENLQINKSITLIPSNGRKAKFGLGFGISGINTGGITDYRVSISGFAFTNGGIDLQNAGESTATFNVTDNQLTGTSGSVTRIRIGTLYGADVTRASVIGNQIKATLSGPGSALVEFWSVSAVADSFSARNNRLETLSTTTQHGILTRNDHNTTKASPINVNIAHNRIYGRFALGAIAVTEGLQTALPHTVVARVANNVIVGKNKQGRGIFLYQRSGIIQPPTATRPLVLNNSLVDLDLGIFAARVPGGSGGSLTGRLQNNLIYKTNQAIFIFPEYTATLTGTCNLYFSATISNSGYTPSVCDQTGNPLIIDDRNPRVSAGSPAIDAGSLAGNLDLFDFSYIQGGANLDADGLRRLKGNTAFSAPPVDIGAYEFGDTFATVQNTEATSTDNTFAITNPEISTSTDQVLQTSQFAGSSASGYIATATPYGVWWSNVPTWNIFLQNLFTTMPASIRFFTLAPLPKFGAFAHVNATAANETIIDNVSSNTRAFEILAVTQNFNSTGGTGAYNNSPIAIDYGADLKWHIFNTNGNNIPVGAAFNVYVTDPSESSFIHTVASTNRIGAETILDSALLNDVPCARLLVTPENGAFGNAITELRYNVATGRWRIFRSGGVDIPLDSRFHIVVDAARTRQCSGDVFADGFEN
jgi:hypothetical protein